MGFFETLKSIVDKADKPQYDKIENCNKQQSETEPDEQKIPADAEKNTNDKK